MNWLNRKLHAYIPNGTEQDLKKNALQEQIHVKSNGKYACCPFCLCFGKGVTFIQSLTFHYSKFKMRKWSMLARSAFAASVFSLICTLNLQMLHPEEWPLLKRPVTTSIPPTPTYFNFLALFALTPHAVQQLQSKFGKSSIYGMLCDLGSVNKVCFAYYSPRLSTFWVSYSPWTLCMFDGACMQKQLVTAVNAVIGKNAFALH
jgi:hypothetical protein